MTNYIVAVYECNMEFGGPEEGGWWFDSGSLTRIMKVFKSEDLAYDYARKLNNKLKSRVTGPNFGRHDYSSVVSEGEYRAYVYDDHAPKYFPEERPHYE